MPVRSTRGRVVSRPQSGLHADGALLIVFYGDYSQPAARATFAALKQVESLADGDVTVVYRHLVTEVRPWGRRLAEAAEVGATFGSFLPMHEALYRISPCTEREIVRAAMLAGIDVDEFLRLWQRGDPCGGLLGRHRALAAIDRVRRAPAVLVDGAPAADATDPKLLWSEVCGALGPSAARVGAA